MHASPGIVLSSLLLLGIWTACAAPPFPFLLLSSVSFWLRFIHFNLKERLLDSGLLNSLRARPQLDWLPAWQAWRARHLFSCGAHLFFISRRNCFENERLNVKCDFENNGRAAAEHPTLLSHSLLWAKGVCCLYQQPGNVVIVRLGPGPRRDVPKGNIVNELSLCVCVCLCVCAYKLQKSFGNSFWQTFRYRASAGNTKWAKLELKLSA